MTIDDGTDPLWGGNRDNEFDPGAEGEVQAGEDPSARGLPDPDEGAKLEWGEDEERGGRETDADDLPNFDPEPDATPPRLTSVDPGDRGGAYSDPGFSEGKGLPTDY